MALTAAIFAVLALVSLLSAIVGCPWTLIPARRGTARAAWDHPLFQQTNTILTLGWAALFALTALCAWSLGNRWLLAAMGGVNTLAGLASPWLGQRYAAWRAPAFETGENTGKGGSDMNVPKLIRALASGSVAFVIANIVSNALFFEIARSVLFDPELQSSKLIAVLFEIEPLPLMFTDAPLYLAVAAALGAVHGLVFMWIEPILPKEIVPRGLTFGVVLWALMALYFEFHAPFNMFGEPLRLVALELGLWAIVLVVEGLALSALYGRGRRVSPA